MDITKQCVYFLNNGACDVNGSQCIGSASCAGYEPHTETDNCKHYDDGHCMEHGIECEDWCEENSDCCDEHEEVKKPIGIDLFT